MAEKEAWLWAWDEEGPFHDPRPTQEETIAAAKANDCDAPVVRRGTLVTAREVAEWCVGCITSALDDFDDNLEIAPDDPIFELSAADDKALAEAIEKVILERELLTDYYRVGGV